MTTKPFTTDDQLIELSANAILSWLLDPEYRPEPYKHRAIVNEMVNTFRSEFTAEYCNRLAARMMPQVMDVLGQIWHAADPDDGES